MAPHQAIENDGQEEIKQVVGPYGADHRHHDSGQYVATATGGRLSAEKQRQRQHRDALCE